MKVLRPLAWKRYSYSSESYVSSIGSQPAGRRGRGDLARMATAFKLEGEERGRKGILAHLSPLSYLDTIPVQLLTLIRKRERVQSVEVDGTLKGER